MKACSFPSLVGRVLGASGLAALLAGACLAQPAPDPDRTARLDAMFDRLTTAGYTGHVAIAVGDDIVFARGAGFADPATNRAFDLDTQIDIGSITKTYTGMVAAALITRGELSAEARLADFFASVPADKADITVHQMLTHSAGFPGAVGDDLADEDFDTFLANAFAAELRFRPGTAYSYSNVGFSLVAAIIEQIEGRAFETVLIEDYLAPAGLTATGYAAALDTANAVRLADGRRVDEVSWGDHPPNWNLTGNGGLLSTPRDMLAWGAAYADATLVSEQARDLAWTAHQSEGGASDYGYGIVVEDDPDFGPLYWHNGGNGYFNAHLRILPDDDLIVFTNANQRRPNADIAAEALTASWFDLDYDLPPARDIAREPIDLPDSRGGRLAGRFLALIEAGETADIPDFVASAMTAEMQAFAPMDRHVSMLRSVQADLAGASVVGVEETDNRVTVLLDAPVVGEIIRVGLDLDDSDPARIAGLSLDAD